MSHEPVLLTVTAGTRSARSTLAELRRRWWVLLVPIAIGTVVATLDREPGVLVGPLALDAGVLVVIAAVVAYRWHVRKATLSVTPTALVLRRWRRLAVPRADIEELVAGWFTTRHPAPQGWQVAVADHEGRARMTLLVAAWSMPELERVARALEVTLRDAEAGDARLRPPWARHPVLTTAGGALALVAAIVAVIVLVDHVQAAGRERAAETASRSFTDEVGTRLTRDVTGLTGIDRYTTTDGEGVGLHVAVRLELPGAEADPRYIERVVSPVCGFDPDLGSVPLETSLEIDVSLADTADDETGEADRRQLDITCDDDQAAALAVLVHARAHPWGDAARYVSIDSRHTSRPDVHVVVAGASEEAFVAVSDAACAGSPPAAAVDVAARSGSSTRADVDCADPVAALADWRG